jgi:hypothetical protein
MSVPTPPGLECLLDLACRDGVDIRPTLLRVLTDLYVQKPSHTAEEDHHYVELAQRLIQSVDHKTRDAVTTRLRDYRKIPPQLLPYLTPQASLDAPDVVLSTPAPPSSDLPALKPTQAVESRVIAPTDAPTLVPAALPHDTSAALSHVQSPPTAAELCDLFFAAPPQDRRLILINLDAVASHEAEPVVDHSSTISVMETAAMRRDRPGFAREIARAINIDIRMAMRIVDDATGEPLLIAARLVGMPENVLQRVLLFLNPMVGRSVQRVFDLSALYEQLSVPAARHMVSILRESVPAAKIGRPTHHETALWHDTPVRPRSAPLNHPIKRGDVSPDFADLPPPFRIGER